MEILNLFVSKHRCGNSKRFLVIITVYTVLAVAENINTERSMFFYYIILRFM